MPRGIAIETSGRVGSVAIVVDGMVMHEARFSHGLQNAAKILPIIDSMCRAQGWSARDVEEIYLSVGPGSFTGLRIGVTIAKTIALVHGVKIVAVPTVRVLALDAPQDARHAIIVLDAKRNQIFTARFERTNDDELIEREPAHLDDLRSMLLRSPRPVHLIGEGIPYHLAQFDANDPQIIVTPQELWAARASVVAKIGTTLARDKQLVDPDRLTPIYIRLPEAEEKRLAAGLNT